MVSPHILQGYKPHRFVDVSDKNIYVQFVFIQTRATARKNGKYNVQKRLPALYKLQPTSVAREGFAPARVVAPLEFGASVDQNTPLGDFKSTNSPATR